MSHQSDANTSNTQLQLNADIQEKRFHVFAVVVLLAFGIYQAVAYYGHLAVPNSDFPAFFETGRSILSFDKPGSFKRLPLLGMLQVILSKVVGTSTPEVTAGWMLNCFFHVGNVLLLYLVGRKLLGKAAFFFALIAAINPWILKMLPDPIVETALIFFTLLTFYFMLKRSSFCYLFAAMAVMTRYEGAALIFTAFIFDMITRTGKKQRLNAFYFAAAASLPFAAWLLATKLAWKPGTSHYLRHFEPHRGHIGFEYFNFMWQTTFSSLMQLPAYIKASFVEPVARNSAEAVSIDSAFVTLTSISKFIAGLGVVIAIPYGIIKRNWSFIAILIFTVCYVAVHSMRFTSTLRYTIPIIWPTLLICCYGLKALSGFINKEGLLPVALRIAVNVILTIVAGVWFIMLLPYLSATVSYSTNSAVLPYIAIVITLLALGMLIFLYRTKYLYRNIAVAAVVCLAVISNQFTLVRQVSNGTKDAEFKQLADWYVENAQPGEIMLTTMPHVISLFLPEQTKVFRHTGSIKAENMQDFTQMCYKKKITYVTWDSRIGLTPNNAYYKRWKIYKMKPLIQPRDLGPYEFIDQIKRSDRRYINIFRLRAEQAPQQ